EFRRVLFRSMFHPIHTFISKFVTDFKAKNLHHDIFINGELQYENPNLESMQAYALKQLDLLWDEYKRTVRPEEYPVDLSQKTWDNRMKNIQEVRESIKKIK